MPHVKPVNVQLQLCWLAGLLEGEGSFLAGPPSMPNSPAIVLAMTDDDIVDRVATIFGNAVFRTDRGHERGWKPAFITRIRGGRAAQWMTDLRPLMGERRQAQIDRALSQRRDRRVRWRTPQDRCATPSCARSVAVRGLCHEHYNSWWRSMKGGRPSRHRPVDPPSPSGLDSRRRVVFPAPDDLEAIAWLAGLLEGEGCFGIAKSGSRSYPRISLHMCDLDVLQRAASMMGASSVYAYADRRAKGRQWSQMYGLAVSGTRAASEMVRLRTFMGGRRSRQIDEALSSYEPIRLVSPPPICVVRACERPHESRGLCHKHYMSWHRDRRRGREPRVTPLR